MQEDVFEKTQTTEEQKKDDVTGQKSAENQVDENPNQTSTKNTEETPIDKQNDNSYNKQGKDVEVREAEKVDEITKRWGMDKSKRGLRAEFRRSGVCGRKIWTT